MHPPQTSIPIKTSIKIQISALLNDSSLLLATRKMLAEAPTPSLQEIFENESDPRANSTDADSTGVSRECPRRSFQRRRRRFPSHRLPFPKKKEAGVSMSFSIG